MVTRKAAFEKQEHGLPLHIQVNQTAVISPRLALRRFMRIGFRLRLLDERCGLRLLGRVLRAVPRLQ
jgi:hypothetical protein